MEKGQGKTSDMEGTHGEDKCNDFGSIEADDDKKENKLIETINYVFS